VLDMTRAEIVQRLASDLGLEPGQAPSWAYKVAALLETDELVYLDALRREAPRGAPWTGEVVAFTDKRVIRVTIEDPADASGTQVTTWGRTSLRSLRVEGSDEYWAGLEQGLAPETRLRLKYVGRRPILIPLDPTIRSRTGELADLLPTLFDDLNT
jgi:hypothetical protein